MLCVSKSVASTRRLSSKIRRLMRFKRDLPIRRQGRKLRPSRKRLKPKRRRLKSPGLTRSVRLSPRMLKKSIPLLRSPFLRKLKSARDVKT